MTSQDQETLLIWRVTGIPEEGIVEIDFHDDGEETHLEMDIEAALSLASCILQASLDSMGVGRQESEKLVDDA